MYVVNVAIWSHGICLVAGIPIDKVARLTQETRNYVGKKLLELTLMELFVFRFMQAGSFFPHSYLFLPFVLIALLVCRSAWSHFTIAIPSAVQDDEK